MGTLSEGHHIGPYQIIRLLGEGGMGAVYEAVQEPIGRRVALKVLLPEFAHNRDVVGRFFNEARAVNLIEHPSLVQVSDFGAMPDGTAYLVMEFLRGEPLESRLRRVHSEGKQLSTSAALLIAGQMADALCAAHEKNIVHRDLKPANIMLVRDPVAPGGERVKILDFGIAKLTQNQGKGTHAKALLGTPRYMSPEQCRGAGEVDEKTDVYALGVILYEMLAGRTPFVGEGHGDFISQHMFREPPPVSDFVHTVPSEVVKLVQTLLLKDRSHRPSMRDVEGHLARLLSSVSGAQALPRPMEDADATRPIPKSATPSTLGLSLGQTKGSARSSILPRFFGASVLGAIALLIAGIYSSKNHGPPAVSPGSQNSSFGQTRHPQLPQARQTPSPSHLAAPLVSPAEAPSKQAGSAQAQPSTGVPSASPTRVPQPLASSTKDRSAATAAPAAASPKQPSQTPQPAVSTRVPVIPTTANPSATAPVPKSQPPQTQSPKPAQKKFDPYDW